MWVDLERVHVLSDVLALRSQAHERLGANSGCLFAEAADGIRRAILVVIVSPVLGWHVSGVQEGLVLVANSRMRIRLKVVFVILISGADTNAVSTLIASDNYTISLKLSCF